MLHPPKSKKKAKSLSRAVVHVPTGSSEPVTIATANGVSRLSGHAAFLNWLVSPDSTREASVVYMADSGIDWAPFVRDLAGLGYRCGLGPRQDGSIGTVFVSQVGVVGYTEHGRDRVPVMGRSFAGRTVGGVVSASSDLSIEDRCVQALEGLAVLDAAIAERWPGVRLRGSLAATGIDILRSYLRRPLGCAKLISAQLRSDRVIGSGRAEMFCPRASVHTESSGVTPWGIDLRGAYLEALASGAPAEYVCDTSIRDIEKPGTITTALVRVPDCNFPPLRHESLQSRVSFPHGIFLGTWSQPELSAALRCGVEVLRVLRVRQFVIRSEFAEWAAGIKSLRDHPDERVKTAAKGIAVQTVGAWASRPSTHQLWSGRLGGNASGVEAVRPAIYRIPREAPQYSDREIIPANAFTTGTVRGWIVELLRALETHRPLWVHTDGLETRESPAKAFIAALKSIPGIPGLESWKCFPLRSTEVYSATRRITVTATGATVIASGGIDSRLPVERIKALMREPDPREHFRSGRRPITGSGWPRAPSIEEADPLHARRLKEIGVSQEK